MITFDYTHGDVGNRLTMTVDGSDLHDYTYDEIYQLTDVDYPAGAGTDIRYAYDGVHNRTGTDDGTSVSYTANNLNQYTAVGGTNLYYDNNGNLTDDGTYDYIYDIFNRLIEVQYNSATVAEYDYDYSGRRIEKTVYGTSTVTTKYAYDGAQVIAEYDGSNDLRRKFIYGPGIDEPICMIDVSDSNSMYYYHYDGLGSVIALSNTDGNIVEAYSYDVFGTPTIYTDAGSDGLWRTSDDTTASVSAIDNPYMFTGRRYDDEAGLYYYRARVYAPDLGCFLQPDPIGYTDGMNMYAYVGNNPLGFVDPWGLEAIIMARPLEGRLGQFLANRTYGKGDVRGYHYQIFYTAGKNSGYFAHDKDKPPIFKSDKPLNLPTYNDVLLTGFDEDVMHLAELRTKFKWQKEWLKGGRRYNHPNNDCQSYINEVLVEYNKITRERRQKACKKP